MPLSDKSRAWVGMTVRPCEVGWKYTGTIGFEHQTDTWSRQDDVAIRFAFEVTRGSHSAHIVIVHKDKRIIDHTSKQDWWQLDAQHNALTLLLTWLCCRACNDVDDFVMVGTETDQPRTATVEDFETSPWFQNGGIEWGPSEFGLGIPELACINEGFLLAKLRRMQN